MGKYLAGFVLCDFVLCVLFALFAFTVGAAGFGNLEYEDLVNTDGEPFKSLSRDLVA